MSAPAPRAVCVFCASSTQIASHHETDAYNVGFGLAERGHVVVSGGGAVSMMGAVARGARDAAGRTIGIIPEVLLLPEVADEDSCELHVTATMRQRIDAMDDRSDAFCIMAGGVGTLQEFFDVWVARTLGLHDKPVVICDPHGAFEALRAALSDLTDAGFIRLSAWEHVHWCDSVQGALDTIDAGLQGRLSSGPTIEDRDRRSS